MTDNTINRRTALTLTGATAAAYGLGVAPALAYTREEMLVAGPLGDKALGDPDAPVLIVEYASFTCPHCATFHKNNMARLKSEYIDTGKVYFIYRDFPLDGRAFGAAILARCAPEKQYFDLVSLFFEQQEKWAFVPGEGADKALLAVAKQAGFTQEKFYACLQNKNLIDGIQWVRERASKRFAVNSTPSVFINGELTRAFEFEDLAKEIDAAK